jgi:hypothetical protein
MKYQFTKKELEDIITKYGSLRKAALGTDIHRDTLRRYCFDLGVDIHRLHLHKPKSHPVSDFKPFTDDELINQLQSRNYFVTKEPQKQDYSFKGNLTPFEGDSYKIAIVGDTHLGSRYQQLSHLHTFYDLCEKEGITDVYHTGDLTDGNGKVYNGQIYEIFVHGADKQVDYVIKNYPYRKNITTHYICGNHDESHYKDSGLDVGLSIKRRRADMHYLGFHGAYIDINGIKNAMYLMHGDSGCSYARSYKLQKIIEQFSPDRKPHMFFLGHYHVCCYLPMYRNVVAWTTPCFQSQTPFIKRKNLYPEIGGLIMEFKIHENKPTLPKFKFVPFYIPKNEDY